jgi:hypothetical protein
VCWKGRRIRSIGHSNRGWFSDGAAGVVPQGVTVVRMYRAVVTSGQLSARFIETLNARDFAAFRELLADTLEYHALVGPDLQSADDVVAFYRKGSELVPTRRIEIDHVVCDGEWAAIEI